MPADESDATAPEPHVPESRVFVSQRLRLHYLDWGNPGAPTLVLVHGGLDHARSWDWTARALRRDWHVIAPDLRGHGDSAWSPDGAYLMPYYACDLAQLIDQLGDGPVTIVGHSLGGAIALRYAALYPERVVKLVVIEGLGYAPDEALRQAARPIDARWREWMAERRALSGRTPRRYGDVEEALGRMRAQFPQLSEEQARHLTVHGLRRTEDGGFVWKYDNHLRVPAPLEVTDAELHALWHAVTCPVLLAYGRDSWASNPAEDGRAAHFRNARVMLFDDAGHWLHHDRFAAFLAALRGFLEEGTGG
ncbi:alpha/beta fold hydrolase [Sphingomonas profundi]|uniref:alpha/beta fold hydrolase n=1 Tax=Alterirhizorhabdus profundi TaxID=2681549 RepID=UPI0012E90A4C|nr:alpha/beta hydrolase [Sphingomonas profundi]